MARVLYISPYAENTAATNGGYGVIAESFKRMFDIIDDVQVDYVNINVLGTNPVTEKLNRYDICILLTHPISFETPMFKRNIEYLFSFCNKRYLEIFWETSIFPITWKWLWKSDLFTGFISPSKFIQDIINSEIKNSNKENHLVYSPTFKNDFTDYKIITENKIDESFFTVLYMGQYTKRKGMEDAIIAFTHALSQYDDCRLILKYHKLSEVEIDVSKLIETIVKTNTKEMKSQIFEVVNDLTKDDIYSLYKESSVLLFPSRGEGYGLPCIEAGMIGLPIIYTDWSATTETAKFKGNKAIGCVLDTAQGMAHYAYESNSLYAVPYIKEMIKALKDNYELWKKDKQEYYSIVAKNNNEIIRKFGQEVFIEQIKKLYNS